jgi:hypothetical protein
MRASILLFLPLFAACNEAAVTKFNANPDAVITSHGEGDTVREGEPELLTGQVGDVDDPPADLNVSWTVGGSETCADSTPEADGSVACEATFTAGGGTVVLRVSDPAGSGASATVELEVQATDAPETTLTSPTTTGTYYANQTITFQGTVADSEDAPTDLIVSIETDALGDLEMDIDVTSEGDVEAFGLLTEGEHAIRLRAIDSSEKEGTDSVVITVGPANSAPTCAITAPTDGSAGPEGEDVRLEGTAADVDIAADLLTANWESDKDGPLGESVPTTSGELGFAVSDLSANTHRITLTVTDDVGARCTQAIYYTVGTPPVVNITAPEDGDIVSANQDIDFSAETSDTEDAPTDIHLEWAIDGDVFSDAGADSSGVASFPWDASTWEPGDHTVEVTATDTHGLYVSDSVSFTINAPPNAPTVVINPDPAYTADNLFAVATGSEDPDTSGSVTYRYVWFADGIEVPEVAGAEYPAESTAKHHTYRVEVFASDGLHESDAGTAERTVSNTAPTITDISVTPDSAPTGTTLVCAATAEDADGDTVAITTTWSDGSAGESTTIADGAEVGSTLICTATANDGDDGTDTATATATVTNTAPVLDMVTVSPDTGQVGDTLTCEANASDADGDDPTITFAWTDGSAGPSYEITSSDDPGDTITCTAIATDSTGGSDSATATATVENTNPVFDSVDVSPDTATVGTVLTCSVSATDADGGTPEISYAWSTGTTGPSYVVTESDDPGDTLTCTATATDDDGGSDSASATALVKNTEPTIVSINVTPSSARVGESLTCTATATDADGGTPAITYSWSTGTVGPEHTIIADDDPGDTLTCTATADDGDGGVVTATASATVDNADPEIDSISITPVTGKVGDVLTCAATASDADGGSPTISYAWSTGSVGSVHAITDADAPGETLTCTVTATDEHGGTDTGTATATVDNSDPVMGTVSISPDAPTNDDTLTCTASATDADGGTPTISYAWSTGTTGATLSLTSETAPGDEITCTATATDCSDSTDTGSASVTVTNRPPSVGLVSIDPDSPTASEDVTCTAGAADPDGEEVTLSYTWDINDAPAGTGTTLSGGYEAGDELTCSVTATDESGESTTATASVTVTNTGPDVSDISLTPSELFTNDTLTASATASDADGDDLTLTYAFHVNGTVVQDSESPSLSGTAHFDKGDTVFVVATADDDVTTDSRTSDTLIVQNTPPTEPEVSITETVTACSAVELHGGSDELRIPNSDDWDFRDNDFTIEMWFKPTADHRQALFAFENDHKLGIDFNYGGWCGGAARNINIWASTTGSSWNLLTADSGGGYACGTVSLALNEWHHVAYVRHGNRWMSFLDGEMDIDITVAGSVVSRDEDMRLGSWGGDVVTHFDGAMDNVRVSSVARYTDDFVTTTEYAPDDGTLALWTFDEGHGTSSTDVASSHDANFVGGPSWGSDCPSGPAGHSLSCIIDGSSTDDDDDPVSYTFEWDLDGEPFFGTDSSTYLDDTITDVFDLIGVWTCEVTPDDGEESGPTAEASIAIEGFSECGGPVTIDTYEYDGMSYYPLHMDDCTGGGLCGAPWTTQQQMDEICQMEGFCEAVDWEVELIPSTSCFCWMGSWASPCCSGLDDRNFVTSVTCD